MGETFKGTIHGKHIELDRELPFPDGSLLLVTIEPLPLPDDELRRRILDLSGAWKDDPSIPAIFEEIARERRAHRERETWIP
jgi:hypothetical protein